MTPACAGPTVEVVEGHPDVVDDPRVRGADSRTTDLSQLMPLDDPRVRGADARCASVMDRVIG